MQSKLNIKGYFNSLVILCLFVFLGTQKVHLETNNKVLEQQTESQDLVKDAIITQKDTTIIILSHLLATMKSVNLELAIVEKRLWIIEQLQNNNKFGIFAVNLADKFNLVHYWTLETKRVYYDYIAALYHANILKSHIDSCKTEEQKDIMQDILDSLMLYIAVKKNLYLRFDNLTKKIKDIYDNSFNSFIATTRALTEMSKLSAGPKVPFLKANVVYSLEVIRKTSAALQKLQSTHSYKTIFKT